MHYNFYHPVLRVDPNMRCAVMLIYGCKLVVIPFYEAHTTQINQADVKSNTIEDNMFIKSEPDTNFDAKHPLGDVKKQQVSTSLSLSSYSIDLRKLDDWLEMRIIDIEFLYGYYEPTLFILSESNRTWVGRYAVKKDTCNSLALSLNLHQKTHPIIWPVDKLPSDCLRCVAVPPPIGGVLLFAVNSLIYINQSIPSYGVALNSIAKTSSNYPFKNMEDSRLTLDCSHCVFVAADRLIVSLKGGEIYIITLLTDTESLRSIRSFNIEKGPSSVISSCLTKCCDNYLFVGSRLGNSVLLKYNVKAKEAELEQTVNEQMDELVYDTLNGSPSQKATNMDDEEEHTGESGDELDQILEKNDQKLNKSMNIVSYTFEICDMLLNIAPCGHSIIGESAGDYSEFKTDTVQYHIDLVSSGGHSKHGAVSVLQRSLRPEIIASFQIPDIVDMWSVYADADTTATYLFLSKLDSTMILQMGNEITELDKETSAFCTKLPTLHCDNLANNKFLLQVTSKNCLLYSECETGPKLVFTYDLLANMDSIIKHVQVCDPYIVVLTTKGSLITLMFNEELSTIELITKTGELNLSSISCFALYRDEHGLLSTKNMQNDSELSKESYMTSQFGNEDKKSLFEDNILRGNAQMTEEMNIDDEDELLYGTSKTDLPFDSNSKNTAQQTAAGGNYFKFAFGDNDYNMGGEGQANLNSNNINVKAQPQVIETTYWLVTVNTDGVLSILNFVDDSLSQTYSVSKFNTAPKTLVLNNHSLESIATLASSIVPPRSSLMDTYQPQVHEILMAETGNLTL